jgi:hypothetical protein
VAPGLIRFPGIICLVLCALRLSESQKAQGKEQEEDNSREPYQGCASAGACGGAAGFRGTVAAWPSES